MRNSSFDLGASSSIANARRPQPYIVTESQTAEVRIRTDAEMASLESLYAFRVVADVAVGTIHILLRNLEVTIDRTSLVIEAV